MKKTIIWLAIQLAVIGGMTYGIHVVSRNAPFAWVTWLFLAVVAIGAYFSFRHYRRNKAQTK